MPNVRFYKYLTSFIPKEQMIFLRRSVVLEYAYELFLTPRAELFCSWNSRKFIGQNKVKCCKW